MYLKTKKWHIQGFVALFLIALIRYNLNTVSSLTVQLVNFGNCIQLHNLHPNQGIEYFFHLENFVLLACNIQPLNLLSLVSIHLLSVTLILLF